MGLELLRDRQIVLLCFADLPADEFGEEGSRLIAYQASSREGPQVRRMMIESHDMERFANLSKLLRRKPLPKSGRERLQGVASDLEQSILGPIDHVIQGASALIFIASGRFADVPLGAILCHGQPLMLRLPTTYAASLSDMSRMTHRVPALRDSDCIVASATHTQAQNGTLPPVPLAGIEAAMLRGMLSEDSTVERSGWTSQEIPVRCLAEATCEELLDCVRDYCIEAELQSTWFEECMGTPPELLALFHYSGHVDACKSSSDAPGFTDGGAGEEPAKQLLLTDGTEGLSGMLGAFKQYASLVCVSACCGDELSAHQSRYSLTGATWGHEDSATVVCCTWPLEDVAGLIMSRDLYTYLVKREPDEVGQGVAEALQCATRAMTFRTRKDLEAEAKLLENELQSCGSESEGHLATRGLAALRGNTQWLQASSSSSSSSDDETPMPEVWRGSGVDEPGTTSVHNRVGNSGAGQEDRFYLSCLWPFLWAGYRCYGIPLLRASPHVSPDGSAAVSSASDSEASSFNDE